MLFILDKPKKKGINVILVQLSQAMYKWHFIKPYIKYYRTYICSKYHINI